MTAEQHDSAYQTKTHDDKLVKFDGRIIDAMVELGASPRDIAVYIALRRGALSNQDSCIMSRQEIARRVGMRSKRSADAAIDYLEGIGLVTKRQRFVNDSENVSFNRDDDYRQSTSSLYELHDDEFIEARQQHLRSAR